MTEVPPEARPDRIGSSPSVFQRRASKVRRGRPGWSSPLEATASRARPGPTSLQESCPMTVRWKPLLILSGLFVVVALVGLMPSPRSWARGGPPTSSPGPGREREGEGIREGEARLSAGPEARRPERRRSTRRWPTSTRNGPAKAPAEKKAELRGLYLASLTASAKNGPKRVEPRRRMLAEAIRQDDVHRAGPVGEGPGHARPEQPRRPLRPGLRASSTGRRPTSPRSVATSRSSTPRRPGGPGPTGSPPGSPASRTTSPGSTRSSRRPGRSPCPADADPVDRMALLRLRRPRRRHHRPTRPRWPARSRPSPARPSPPRPSPRSPRPGSPGSAC